MDPYLITITCCVLISQVSTFQIPNKTKISVAGATIRLSCPVNCSESKPEWSFGGTILADGFKINPESIQKSRLSINQSCDLNTFSLVISNITETDEGRYCCDHKLIQYCTILEITELVIQTDENNTVHGVAEKNLSLACFLTKAVQRVHIKAISNHSVVASATSAQLNVSLTATKELNGKTFSCAAMLYDLDISLNKNVILNISYPPGVRIKILPSSNLLVGSYAFFVCSYDSNPSPVSILWQKNGSDLSTNETFVINDIAIADAGHYRCIVNNGIFAGEDNIKINVLYGKILQLKNDSLICNATDLPANYTFSYWEHQTTAGTHIRFLTQKSNEMIQFVDHEGIPTYKINGRYVCIVENMSIAYKDVFLPGKPTCLECDKELFGQVGRNFVITVKVYSPNCSIFNWWKGDMQLTNTSKYIIIRNETLTIVNMYNKYVEIETTTIGLEIKQLTENDFNIPFTVTIYNTKGNCTCTMFLRTSEIFHHKGLILYVVTTFICNVIILIAIAIYAKRRKIYCNRHEPLEVEVVVYQQHPI